ncbi:unnamed protein product [Adineta steineri]|uniref:CKK domain-containing protein n=1 Tax=Adineta steineri TaxID=433720 RepID=A0A818HDR7_9BILA|nr:unnamed protein product [Adineta steineri]CAF3502870.1 unnamed protein product [Adineta steineri]
MTTVVSTSNSEVSTPASYVSRWIAQSHGKYQKKNHHHHHHQYYSPSYDYQTRTSTSATTTISIIKIPTTSTSNSHMTTWEAQAKTRSDGSTINISTTSDSFFNTLPIVNHMHNNSNNDLQEKLNRVRALLDAKKQRLCRHVSSASPSSTTTIIPLTTLPLQDQVYNATTVGDQSSSPPLSSPEALENVYHSHDECISSSNCSYLYNSCQHHHNQPSILPCLVEESPSDSGLSDATKTTNHDDINELTTKNAAIIDLSKPLSKEEMLAIMQIIRELWKKQFDCEIPDVAIKQPVITSFKRIGEMAHTIPTNTNNNRAQYQSAPVLNKLNAELNDIKDKIKKFSSERQQKPSSVIKSIESDNNHVDVDHSTCYNDSGFVLIGAPLSARDLERMQMKKEALLRRQIQRREQILKKRTERQAEAAERHDEYRLFEEYLAQRRQEDEQRRTNILQAHLEQKRREADPPSSHDYYFAAARNRNRLKRKASVTSFLSLDDDLSCTGSLNITGTPKRSSTRFDFMSPSITAPTAASKSKMNRAASICSINGCYDSSTSLNSKSVLPTSLFGGSLMNLSKFQTPKKKTLNLMDDSFCESVTSLATSATARLTRSQTLLTTKSNKQAIINSLKQVALAGPANERQREIMIREIESSDARHFVLLFRDHRLQFRAVYMYIAETDMIEKLHGIGPNIITEIMVDKWYKYNSGSKRFTNIPIKHFSIQCDAVVIYNDFWQKKLHMNKLH